MEIVRKIFFFILDTAQTFLIAFAVFLAIYWLLFRPFQVNGQSMFPTFHNGEYVLTNLITERFNDPKKGEVIVFESPTEKDKEFIKRVMATPGDTIELRDGEVYVNRKKVNESPYLSSDVKTYGGAFLHENQPVTIPNGVFFVMGDNRPFSSDSREWGFVKKSLITGSSMFVYWPPNRARLIQNPFGN